MVGQLGALGRVSGLGENDGLFGEGMGEHGGGLGNAGGVAGAAGVMPRVGESSEVENLPSGEGVCLGENGGQRSDGRAGGGVGEQRLDVIDVQS